MRWQVDDGSSVVVVEADTAELAAEVHGKPFLSIQPYRDTTILDSAVKKLTKMGLTKDEALALAGL